jgi:TRAP-type C4-dicarboxylate transport system substrate-binding protein
LTKQKLASKEGVMKDKKYSLLLAVIIVTALLLSLPGTAQCQGKGKVIELTMSNHRPPEDRISKGLDAWANEVTKRTNGRVKVVMYHSDTLTTAAKCYEGAVKGISDMCHAVLSYNAGRFPVMEAFEIPGYPVLNAHLTTRIVHEMYQKFKPKELDDVHVLYIHAHAPGTLFTTKKPVRKLEDMKGLRIRSTGTSNQAMEYLGARAVGMPKSEQYDALAKGIADGTLGTAVTLKGMRIVDVCKYSTWIPKAGYANAFAIVMNKKKWASLPPDIQKIFTEVSEEWVGKAGDCWNDADIEAIEFAKKLGHTFIFPDEKESARWENALKPMSDDYLKRMKSKGFTIGEEVLKYRLELIEKYSKIYKPIVQKF